MLAQKPPQIIDLQLMIALFFSGILLSLRPDCWWYRDFGGIAQLVEQRTENPCVAGSIPAPTTEIKRVNSSLFLCPLFAMLNLDQEPAFVETIKWIMEAIGAKPLIITRRKIKRLSIKYSTKSKEKVNTPC